MPAADLKERVKSPAQAAVGLRQTIFQFRKRKEKEKQRKYRGIRVNINYIWVRIHLINDDVNLRISRTNPLTFLLQL